jgi:chromate transporter
VSGHVPLWRFSAYFLRLGATGFGGPIALAGFMQRDLVEDRRWISAQDYTDGLALAQLAPGPLAAQLAIYLGFVRAGTLGATLVGICFILPSFLIVWALAVAYVRFGGLPWMQSLFYGIGAAVIGIIARSALKLTTLTLRRSALLWGIAVVMALTTAWTEREIAWLFVLAGVVTAGLAIRARDRGPADRGVPVVAVMALASPPAVAMVPSLPNIFWVFAKAGAFVFGSGLAIVPFLYGDLVQTQGWLDDRQFLDAVAVAMITPGPVVITVAFIGYLVGGAEGMTVAAIAVFLPVYLFVVLPAPYFRRHRDQPVVKGFVDGVSAAATGAIAGAAYVLATRAISDVTTGVMAMLTFVVLVRWRVSELWVIAAAAAIGLVMHASPVLAEQRPAPESGPTVLFMCPKGAAKSVLASAYFTALARERGLNVRVESAGTDPDAQVAPAVAAHLKKQAIEIPIAAPQKVTAPQWQRADVIISIGCDLTGLAPPPGKLVKWDEVPALSEDFGRADAAIRARVIALVDELLKK